MRQIVLDTETTGIGAEIGHRIIEIGCVELLDRELTGNYFHQYINPQRTIDEGAFRVHGLSNEFLSDKPLFADITNDFITFIDQAELIIHNAPFDVGFLNAELKRVQWQKTINDHCRIFDTLAYARGKHPGQRNNLDALCKRYEIDNSTRQFHGALLDAEILAAVYLAMTGGQGSLFTEAHDLQGATMGYSSAVIPPVLVANTLVITPTLDEIAEHEQFVRNLIKKSGINLFEQSSS